MTSPETDVVAFVRRVKERIDAQLDELLPPQGEAPRRIHEAMRYSMLDGGKRLRPALMAAAAEALGRSPEDVQSAACAVEMIHVCSLILDDLPSMDDAELRHGRKANHLVFGEAHAILAALALLNLAYGTLSEACGPDEALRARVIDEAVSGIGTHGMIAGQAVDLESTGKDVNDEVLQFIESHKTGALIVAAVRIAAILCGADDAQLTAVTAFARNLGVAYQISDDVLHVTRDPSDLGKLSRRDESSVSYARVHGVEGARHAVLAFTQLAVAALDDFDDNAHLLRGLAEYLETRVS